MPRVMSMRFGWQSLASLAIWPPANLTMRDYFIRRFLLLFPTLLVISIIVFGITRLAPGGPVEKLMQEMKTMDLGGDSSAAMGQETSLSEEQKDQLKELYGLDKPTHEAYLIWLGLKPREVSKKEVTIPTGAQEFNARVRLPAFSVMELDWDGDGRVRTNEVPKGLGRYVKFEQLDVNGDEVIDATESKDVGEIKRAREIVRVAVDANGELSIANPNQLMRDWSVRLKEEPASQLREMNTKLGEAADALWEAAAQARNHRFSELARTTWRSAETLAEWSARSAEQTAESRPQARHEIALLAEQLGGLNKKLSGFLKSDYVKLVRDPAREHLARAAASLAEAEKEARKPPQALVYLSRYMGVLQGELGTSILHGESVWEMIKERFRISTYFGVLTFMAVYLVCIPLGILKAMKHNTWVDNGTSVLIFVGYSIPGYVLGALMMVFLAARMELFPTGGFEGEHYQGTPVASATVNTDTDRFTAKAHGLKDGESVWFEGTLPEAEPKLEPERRLYAKVIDQDTFQLYPEPELADKPLDIRRASDTLKLMAPTPFWDKVKDRVHHTILPLCCYLVGAFALVTMLMKNHLMDNLSADYMRTAIAKGVPFHTAVRRHALRNSFIPIATNLGQLMMLFVSGSFLIETIFDINGFGLLGFKAVLGRDFPVVMGVLMLSASLMLLGNIISDILVALVDPRVRFE